MKALSIRQPWAWLIANGHKDIENRSWKTDRRGRIAVHASKSFDKDGYAWVKRNFPDIDIPELNGFRFGGVVGTVVICDCVTEFDSPWFAGPYGFVLEEPEEIEFVELPGKLSFFDVDVV